MDPAQIDMTRQREREADEERYLQAAQEAFPGWQISEEFGAYLAVPAGAPVVRAMTLDGLITRLREREDGR